jgi:hypothetical protein
MIALVDIGVGALLIGTAYLIVVCAAAIVKEMVKKDK